MAQLPGHLHDLVADDDEDSSIDGPPLAPGFAEKLLGIIPVSDRFHQAMSTNAPITTELRRELESEYRKLLAQKDIDDALRGTRLNLLFAAQPDPPIVQTHPSLAVTPIIAIAAEALGNCAGPSATAAQRADFGVSPIERDSVLGCDARSIYASCFEEDFCCDGHENIISNSELQPANHTPYQQGDGRLNLRAGVLDSEALHVQEVRTPNESFSSKSTKTYFGKQGVRTSNLGQRVFSGILKLLQHLLSSRPKTVSEVLLWVMAAPVLLIAVAPIYQGLRLYARATEWLLCRTSWLQTRLRAANQRANTTVTCHFQSIISTMSRVTGFNGYATNFMSGCMILASVPILAAALVPGMCLFMCYWTAAFWVHLCGQFLVAP